MTVKQTDLAGKVVDKLEVGSEDASIWKSVLQKAVRRGMARGRCMLRTSWLL